MYMGCERLNLKGAEREVRFHEVNRSALCVLETDSSCLQKLFMR